MSPKPRVSAQEPIEDEMPVPKPFGPGDHDGIDRGASAAIAGPLGPGDDEPNAKDRGTAGEIRGPLAPGETDPADKRPPFRMLAPSPAGPGQVAVQRRITVFPIETKE